MLSMCCESECYEDDDKFTCRACGAKRYKYRGVERTIQVMDEMSIPKSGRSSVRTLKKMIQEQGKFYVGSRSAFIARRSSPWAKKTLEAAVNHARELVDSTGEDQFVVQVVRIVAKQKTPTKVEKV
jgi:hypothetical protein